MSTAFSRLFVRQADVLIAAVVIKAIEPGIKGRVAFQGSHWDAEADASIPENTPVKIIGKENITLKVEKL